MICKDLELRHQYAPVSICRSLASFGCPRRKKKRLSLMLARSLFRAQSHPFVKLAVGMKSGLLIASTFHPPHHPSKFISLVASPKAMSLTNPVFASAARLPPFSTSTPFLAFHSSLAPTMKTKFVLTASLSVVRRM
jgi:hypothetical protein